MSFLSPRLAVPPLLALLAFANAGCSTTPQQRAAQKQAEAENMMQVYGPACARLGYAPNSDAWRNCIVSLSTKDDLLRYGSPGYYPGWGPYWHGGGYWGPYW